MKRYFCETLTMRMETEGAMSRLGGIFAAGMTAAGLASGGAAAQELNVAIFGGSFADNMRACVAEPFRQATGAQVNFVLGNSVQNAARLRATKGNPDVDVAYMDLSLAVQAKAEQLLDTLDPARVTHLADIYPAAVDGDRRFVGFSYAATLIAYNPRETRTKPASWRDLWNPDYRGRIALGDISATSGQHFLIAAARLNGGSIDNLEPGFQAIRELKPHVMTFYTQADQVIPLIQRGDIAIAVWFSDRTAVAANSGVPVAAVFPSEGAIGIQPSFAIPTGAHHKALAEQYIDLALSVEAQACVAQRQFLGPTNRKVELADDVARLVPYRDTVERLYFPPPEIQAASLPTWMDRWNREIGR
jgi:putative spermidine/putrescine transport system substrate-binding protein